MIDRKERLRIIERDHQVPALSGNARKRGAYEVYSPESKVRYIISPVPLDVQLNTTPGIVLPELITSQGAGNVSVYTYLIPFLSSSLEAVNVESNTQQSVFFKVRSVQQDFFQANGQLITEFLQRDENWAVTSKGQLIPIFFPR
jgi:hypothetical protein